MMQIFVDQNKNSESFSQHRKGVKIKTTKISSRGDTGESENACTSENFPLYFILYTR